MAYDISCGANYTGRPAYQLYLYVRRNAVSGNSSQYAWELYEQNGGGGTAWSSNATPWAVGIGGQYWTGNANQDFRNTNRITIASAVTQYFAHDGNGNLNLTVAANHTGDSPIGGAAVSCTFATDRINVPKVPDATTPIGIDEVTSTSFRYRFSGNGNGGSAITAWQTQIATNSAFTANAKIANSSGTTTFEDLTPGTAYWVRSRGVNAVGAGPWSSALSTTTLAGGFIHTGSGFVRARPFINLGSNSWDDAVGFINLGGNSWASID